MDITKTFMMLGDKTRLRIVVVLFQGTLCVCELEEILNVSQVNISRHLMKLKENNIVMTKRTSRRIYYSLSKQIEKNKELKALIEKALVEEKQLLKDKKRYNKHMEQDNTNYHCKEIKKKVIKNEV